MIQKPQNWENVQVMTDRVKLPVGAYVCRVKQVSVQNTGYGDQLAVLFDIVEGEHKDYFSKDYNGNQNADRKWRGVLRQWLPKDDGSDRDETTKRIFKGMVTAFENSNPGYRWDWNEASLVNRTVGIMFRNEEWDYNGKHGWAARPFYAMSVDKVRSGDYSLPDDKPLNNGNSNSFSTAPAPVMDQTSGYQVVNDDDGDLPF